MASILATIADAVVTLLQAGSDAGSFYPAFSPQRGYDVRLLLEDSGILHVDVLPSADALSEGSRVSLNHRAAIDVAVRKVFTADDEDAVTGKITSFAVDALLELVEDIANYLAVKSRRGLTPVLASWDGCEIIAPWDAEHLVQNRQFTGILRAFYRFSQDVS